jgi:hypothetical protein
MEDYKIRLRCGRSEPTGEYEITRMKTRRAVTKFREFYETDAGEYSPEEWIKIVRSCVEASDSLELLDRVIEHCRTDCVWLKTESEREEYSLDMIAGRVYRHWKEFSTEGVTENTAFVFEFSKEDMCGGMRNVRSNP